MKMKTYLFVKSNGSKWYAFYNTEIKLWTTYPVDDDGCQITDEAEYYPRKSVLIQAHGFDFKNATVVQEG